MKPRTWIFYCVAALLIGGFSVIFAVGLMTFVFTSSTGTFAPSNSTDAAAWFQAAGSILAIIGSYHIGARQSAEMRQQAEERRQEIASRREGYFEVIETVYAAGDLIRTYAAENPGPMFGQIWQAFLDKQSAAALRMFDALPLHELGGAQRMEPATRIRGCVDEMRTIVLGMPAWAIAEAHQISHFQTRIRLQGEILDSCNRRLRETTASSQI